MATASLYRRILPSPPAVDFASSEGKQLFVEAIQSGTMEGFYKLISYFQTQSEPAYCGLASLAMVLNALAIDPGRKWKGPWRWFDESMLDCCEPLEKVKDNGISFGKVVCLAHCAGAKVEAFRTNQSTLDDFRKYVTACSSSDDCHVISSYHRGTLKQTGSGHFSPIGGYHVKKDMALILDVARFKYPPHWVPLSLLWEAMNTVDDATGLHRGFMLISRLQRSPAHLYTLSCKNDNWLNIANYLVDDVPLLLRSEGLKDVKNVFSIVFMSLPSNFTELIKWVAEVRRSEDSGHNLNQEEQERLALKEGVLTLVRETALYKHVMDFFLLESLCCLTIPTMSSEDNLPDMAESICCLGAGALTGKSGSFERFYCRETCIKHLKANGNKSITVVSGTVVSNNGEQVVDVLVPSSSAKSTCSGSGLSNCINTHPNSSDVFTTLLLALSPITWAGIKDDELKREINCLVSTKNLPTLLQDEILHLRVQLHLLKRCKDNKVTRQEALGVSRVHLHSSPDVEAKFLLARPRVCSKINNHVTRDGLPFLRRLAASNHAINWLVKPTVKQAQVWGGIRDMMMTFSKYALYTK